MFCKIRNICDVGELCVLTFFPFVHFKDITLNVALIKDQKKFYIFLYTVKGTINWLTLIALRFKLPTQSLKLMSHWDVQCGKFIPFPLLFLAAFS